MFVKCFTSKLTQISNPKEGTDLLSFFGIHLVMKSLICLKGKNVGGGNAKFCCPPEDVLIYVAYNILTWFLMLRCSKQERSFLSHICVQEISFWSVRVYADTQVVCFTTYEKWETLQRCQSRVEKYT